MKTLYQIVGDAAAIDQLLTDCGGVLGDAEEAAIDKWMGELKADVRGKADGYCQIIANLEASSAARDNEAKRLASLATIDQNAADRLRARLKAGMEAMGLTTIETKHFKVGIVANGGKQPVVIDDAAIVPNRFNKIAVDINKAAVGKALADGDEVPGAHLGERGTRLSIR